MKNAEKSMQALKAAQKDFEGEAERTSVLNEEDILKTIKSVRQDKSSDTPQT